MKGIIKTTCTKAMEWLGKMYYMESALESDDLSQERRQSLERQLQWIRHGLNVLPEEERKILLWIADGCTVDEMCEMTCREKSSLYKIRKRAMNRFSIALFGRMR
ncbi:MAG: sigma-70 family RNA polymerase sigma factor [Clostridia bacterium]|nr:sigma-70 family RNA polymerase sigma factor [Clostridia bacterium]